MSIDTTTSPARLVRETVDETVRVLVHPEWSSELGWLVHGTTTRGAPSEDFDLGLFSGGSPDSVVRANWDRLLARTEMAAAVHAPQPHGSEVRWHASARPGLRVVGSCDGHATDLSDVLLAVSTADCVPLFIVAPEARTVAVVHAGWRGAAAGALERGLEVVAGRARVDVSTIHVHLGPAICGACYEVGPEVFGALGLPAPGGPRRIDLRAVLATRAVARGVAAAKLTASTHCTRCSGSSLFSRRGGDRGCQVGFIGVRG